MKACDSQATKIVLTFCIFALLGCEKKIQEYRMNQPISMGPFTFEVERTEEYVRPGYSEGPVLEVRVYYRMLDNKSVPFGKTLSETLLEDRIIDKAGNSIECSGPRVVSGDQRHPSEWFEAYDVSPSMMGVRDRSKLGQKTSDFRLVIDNPDVREGQPERVSIELH
jgi:hypothetical protein